MGARPVHFRDVRQISFYRVFGHASDPQTFNSGETIESCIETHDSGYATLFHGGKVHGITGGQALIAKDNLLGASDYRFVDRDHFIHNSEKCVESRLDRIPTPDCGITMQYFLQHFGVGE